MTKVCIAEAKYLDSNIERLLEPLGGMERFIHKGDRVLLKINLLFKGFKLPNTAAHLLTGGKISGKSPIIKDRCVGCGECERICPGGAVTIVDNLASVTYSKCIRCFCCHEVCPENAIRLGKKR